LANVSYPTLEISHDEDEYVTIKTTAPFKTQITRFRIGEEFDEERMDGKMVKVGQLMHKTLNNTHSHFVQTQSFVTSEGNVFTQIQRDTEMDLEIKYVREFTGDQIKVVRKIMLLQQ